MSHTATFAPNRAHVSEAALPMPCAAPVIAMGFPECMTHHLGNSGSKRASDSGKTQVLFVQATAENAPAQVPNHGLHRDLSRIIATLDARPCRMRRDQQSAVQPGLA